MDKYILVKYSEIALKGGNRPFFEKKLVSNIEKKLSDLKYENVKRIFGRIIVELGDAEIEEEKYKQKLEQVFGTKNFSFAIMVDQEMEEIKKQAWQFLKLEDFDTFSVATKRSQKDFPITSPEVNEKVGSYIVDKLKKNNRPYEVDLDNPDSTVFIELVEDYTFIFTNKYSGPGGLPVTTAGKVVSMISSGIDSPVAAWKMMKRGCKNIFCHFHSFPLTKKQSKVNVERVIEKISDWQLGSKGYFVNLHDIQKEIIMKAPPRLRLIFYRRVMFKISENIAKEEGALGVVTGESVAQVASQTLENMNATSQAIQMPIYRPNAGNDKYEIIKIAKDIDTFDISTEQVEDCCTYMVPDHPETKADLEEVLEVESKLEIEKLIEKAVDTAEVKKF